MPTIAASQLEALARTLVAGMGSAPGEAALVAAHLVGADMSGHPSHGIGMLPTYARILTQGLLVPNQRLAVESDHGAVMVLDGGRGFGQVMAHEAMIRGIERARAGGAVVIGLKNAMHVGRIGHYGEQCARAGLASIHFVNVADHHPLQATFGGRIARLGTNPFCAAVPVAGGDPIVLDMATSSIAFGKARVARNKGVAVPEGSLIDKDGRPTTDPVPMVDRFEGALLPFGAHKGSGLAIMCELLGAALIGGQTITRPWQEGIVNNMLSIVIDPARFGSAEAIGEQIMAVEAWIREAQPAPGVDRVLLPGEPERAARARQSGEGVPVDPVTLEELMQTGAGLGLERAELEAIVAGDARGHG